MYLRVLYTSRAQFKISKIALTTNLIYLIHISEIKNIFIIALDQ
jgi:hypothetical protein